MKASRILAASCAALVWVGCSGGSKEVSAVPQNPAERKFVQGEEAAAKGRWETAAHLFGEAARLAPSFSEAVVNQGIALERQGKAEEAMEAFKNAYEMEPHNSSVVKHYARSLILIGDVDVALAALGSVESDDLDFQVLKASALRRAGKTDRAIAIGRKVLLQDQKHVAAMKVLALSYVDQGNLELGEIFLRNSAELAKKDSSIEVNLGLIASKRGDEQLAIQHFEKALTINPKDPIAQANVGAIALKYRDYKRAAGAYETAIEGGLVTCETLPALGFALQGAQDSAKALSALKRAATLCPKQTDIHYAMGSVCLEQTRDAKCALEHFEAFTQSEQGLEKDHKVYSLIDALRDEIKATNGSPDAG